MSARKAVLARSEACRRSMAMPAHHRVIALLACQLVPLGIAHAALAGPVGPGDVVAFARALVAQGGESDIDCSHPEMKDLPACKDAPQTPPPGTPPRGAGPGAGPGAGAGAGPAPIGKKTDPSVGFSVLMTVFNRGVLTWEQPDASTKGTTDFFMRPVSPGVSLFLETKTKPFSLGIDSAVWFLDVQRRKPEGGSVRTCTECKWDFVFACVLAGKYRIPAGRWVTPYPLLGVGFGAMQSYFRGSPARSHLGFSFALGAGLEANVIPRGAVPFFELRYQLVGGYSHEKDPTNVKEWLHFHALLMSLGLRFF